MFEQCRFMCVSRSATLSSCTKICLVRWRGIAAWDSESGLLGQRLAAGHRDRHPGAFVELSNWHPALVVAPADVIWSSALDERDFLVTVARGHGYADWAAVEAVAAAQPSEGFERSVEALLDGDLAVLQAQLTRDPRLVTQRSHWGHRSTLLHYIAANGVETYRQRVPHNAAEIVRCLLAYGADEKARADMYGGGQTVLGLLLTSQHPKELGVTAQIAELCRRPVHNSGTGTSYRLPASSGKWSRCYVSCVPCVIPSEGSEIEIVL